MRKFLKLLKNQKGLTLVELLAVIVILAIVAAIAVPSIGGIINNSKDKAILSDATIILAGAKLAYTSGDCKGTSAATATTADDEICDGVEINDYVDGVTLTQADLVTKTSTDWTLTWTGLAEANFSSTTSKFKVPNGSTETVILEKLNQ